MVCKCSLHALLFPWRVFIAEMVGLIRNRQQLNIDERISKVPGSCICNLWQYPLSTIDFGSGCLPTSTMDNATPSSPPLFMIHTHGPFRRAKRITFTSLRSLARKLWRLINARGEIHVQPSGDELLQEFSTASFRFKFCFVGAAMIDMGLSGLPIVCHRNQPIVHLLSQPLTLYDQANPLHTHLITVTLFLS